MNSGSLYRTNNYQPYSFYLYNCCECIKRGYKWTRFCPLIGQIFMLSSYCISCGNIKLMDANGLWYFSSRDFYNFKNTIQVINNFDDYFEEIKL